MEGILILRSIYDGAVEFKVKWEYWFFVVGSLIVGYYAWEMIVALPKPETFIELGKYYFTDTGDYLKATGLSLLTGILLILSSFIALVSAIVNECNYGNIYRWFIIIAGSLVGITSVYFLYYGGYLLLVLVVIGLIGIFLFNSDTSSKRRR